MAAGDVFTYDIGRNTDLSPVTTGVQLGGRQLAEQEREFNERMKFYREQLDLQKTMMTSGGGGLTSLINEYQQAYAEAKAGKEQRYQEQLSLANQVSGQAQADVISRYQRSKATATQGLQRQGLNNPLSAMGVNAGTTREQNAELNRLSDMQLQQKLGIISGYTEMLPSTDVMKTMSDYLTGMYGGFKFANI